MGPLLQLCHTVVIAVLSSFFRLRFSNLEKFSLCGFGGGSTIQSFSLQETWSNLTHLEGRQEMSLHRNVITRCLNNKPRCPAAAVSAWFDLLQGLLS